MLDFIFEQYYKCFYNDFKAKWIDEYSESNDKQITKHPKSCEGRQGDNVSNDQNHKIIEKYDSIINYKKDCNKYQYEFNFSLIILFVISSAWVVVFVKKKLVLIAAIAVVLLCYVVGWSFWLKFQNKKMNNCSYKWVKDYRIFHLNKLLSQYQFDGDESIKMLISNSKDRIDELNELSNRTLSIPFVSSIFSVGLFPLLKYVFEYLDKQAEAETELETQVAIQFEKGDLVMLAAIGIVLLVFVIVIVVYIYSIWIVKVMKKIMVCKNLKEDLELLLNKKVISGCSEHMLR